MPIGHADWLDIVCSFSGIGNGPQIAFAGRMSRDHTKLRFFSLADQLVLDVYLVTKSLPDAERYGLQSQIRRAAVSVVTNIVEGAAHRSDLKYLHHLEISLGSAQEVRYLIDLTARLKLLAPNQTKELVERYTDVIKSTQALISTILRDLKLRADS